MTPLLVILLVILVAATGYVLVRGVMTMAQGKDLTGAKSQDLMRKRVMLQAAAIIVAVILLMVSRGSGG